MRLLIDENCAQAELLSRLRAAGHDVETVVAAVGSGARDEDVVSYAIAQRRAIVTKDVADFTALLSTYTSVDAYVLSLKAFVW